MTLSSVSEGFVLLRNLWEYNSVLKYRYKKRKAYKVATMKHLPAPQAKEYKPNLAVRFVKVTLSHFRDGLQGMGSLISGESSKEMRSKDWYRANGWTKQESYTQIPSSWNPPPPKRQIQQPLGNGGLESYSTLPKQEVKYKYNIGDKVELFDGYVGVIEAREIIKGRVAHIRYTYKRGDGKTHNCIEEYIKGFYKQEVSEKRKLTHVRYVGDEGSHYAFTKGKVYEVEYYRKHNDDSEYIKVIGDVSPSEITPHWCFSLYGRGGAPNDIKRFELIYDNEIEDKPRIWRASVYEI